MSDENDVGHLEGCLHCALRETIEEWALSGGHTTPDGLVEMNDVVMAAGIGALIADLMAQAPAGEAATEFMRMVMESASQCYPVYRTHYEAEAQSSILENFQPRGKPS